MKSTKEMIEVMQAYERGGQIQEKVLTRKSNWENVRGPYWDWNVCDYRVKPKREFVPFEASEEFLEAQKAHGTSLTNSNGVSFESSINCLECITLVSTHSDCATEGESFETIFKDFTFQDGTPCGKEVEE